MAAIWTDLPCLANHDLCPAPPWMCCPLGDGGILDWRGTQSDKGPGVPPNLLSHCQAGALPEVSGGWFVWRGTVWLRVAEICEPVLGAPFKTAPLNAGGVENSHSMAIIGAPRR
jgi:hypothetical protein